MKWWQVAMVIVFAWWILVIGGAYFLNGMNDDHLAEVAGEFCGFGTVIIPVGVFLLRKRSARG
jgi:hypothetical protein